MGINKSKYLKLDILNLFLLFLLSILGFSLEFVAIFNSKFKLIGILGDLFYFYIFLIEFFIFGSSFFYYYKNSPKYISFYLVGALLAIVGSVLNILTLVSHVLLFLPPISDKAYTNGWSITNDLSLILLLGLLSLPFIIRIRRDSFNINTS